MIVDRRIEDCNIVVINPRLLQLINQSCNHSNTLHGPPGRRTAAHGIVMSTARRDGGSPFLERGRAPAQEGGIRWKFIMMNAVADSDSADSESRVTVAAVTVTVGPTAGHGPGPGPGRGAGRGGVGWSAAPAGARRDPIPSEPCPVAARPRFQARGPRSDSESGVSV